MQAEVFFRIMLPILIVAFAAHRGYYVKTKSRPDDATLKKREEGIMSKFASLLGFLGFVSMIVYTIHPAWLVWASLNFPVWVRGVGMATAVLGFVLLQSAQETLVSSWSDTPRMMKGQALITNGPYRFIRHPIYTAFILILSSTLFISSNWFIGLCWAGMTFLEVNSRIGFEESLMIEYFGEQYQEYIKQTGRLFPKLM